MADANARGRFVWYDLPNWLQYIQVDSADRAVERVQANGGKVLNGPMDVPGGDRIAQCLDPQGGAFAVHSRKAS